MAVGYINGVAALTEFQGLQENVWAVGWDKRKWP